MGEKPNDFNRGHDSTLHFHLISGGLVTVNRLSATNKVLRILMGFICRLCNWYLPGDRDVDVFASCHASTINVKVPCEFKKKSMVSGQIRHSGR